MTWVLLFVAVTNLGLGYYLGSRLLLPIGPFEPVAVAITAAAPEPVQVEQTLEIGENHQTTNPTSKAAVAAATSKNGATKPSSKCWDTSCTNIRQDIATLYDRIRYAITANDKQLARMIVSELQTRIPLWQKLLAEKLTAYHAELERNPNAKVDCVAPELCLAQTETLQTNLALLDWSDTADSILKKLEREVEAVKHVLPANC